MLILALAIVPFLLFLLLLAIPIDLAVRYESGEGLRSRIAWLFGLISRELGGERENQKNKPKKVKARNARRSFQKPLAIFRVRGFLGTLLLLIRRLVRSIHVRDVDVELEMGTGDPAETGLIFGLIGPSVAMAGSGFSSNIRIQPNFVENIFEGHAQVAVRVYPIMLIPPLVAFVLSPATLRGLWIMQRARQG